MDGINKVVVIALFMIIVYVLYKYQRNIFGKNIDELFDDIFTEKSDDAKNGDKDGDKDTVQIKKKNDSASKQLAIKDIKPSSDKIEKKITVDNISQVSVSTAGSENQSALNSLDTSLNFDNASNISDMSMVSEHNRDRPANNQRKQKNNADLESLYA